MVFFFLASLAMAGLFHPEQVHLSFTENQGEIRVTWTTWISLSSTLSYRATKCSGQAIEAPWFSISGKTAYWSSDFYLYLLHQFSNYATISNLERSCIYEFKVSNWFFRSKSFKFSGRTPEVEAPFEDNKKPIHMWVYGDLGAGKNAVPTVKLLQEKSVLEDLDGIFHFGDIAYDMDTDLGLVGNAFLNLIEPIAAQFPYMVGIGNHDFDRRNNTNYKNRFSLPKNQANEGTGLFYSFNLGPVHFINLNTVYFGYYKDRAGTQLETQYNWLVKDLEEVQKQREEFPWIIVFTHLSMYCSTDYTDPKYEKHYHECLRDAYKLQDYMQDLLYENTVDIVFQGHVHNYERDTAIYKNISYVGPQDTFNKYVDSKAPIYILSGNAGNRDGHNDPIPESPQLWARYLTQEYGIGEMWVYNNTHLYFQQWEAANQTVVDYVWIVKNNHLYQ